MTPGAWIGVGAGAAVVALLLRFMWWRSRAARRARRDGRVAQTALGPVEYAIAGSGPMVMVLHGGLGGFDQGLLLSAELGIRERFTVLCPSRAGYLRTPLSTCATPEESADALAALLEALGVGAVAVVGISGGGPTALQFALRHGGRARALVMVAAISRRHEQPDGTRRGVGRLLFSDAGLWLIDLASWVLLVGVARWRPSPMARWFLERSEALDAEGLRRRVREVVTDPERIASMRRHLGIVLPLSLRKTGLSNDLLQFARLPDYPVERITCPTLVVHGRLDGNVPLEHAEFVAGRVPRASCRVIDCGHFFSLSPRAAEVRACAGEFLERTACSRG